MPVRFRCPHCNRLLGIARRKAGSQIDCPQCGRPLTVPAQDGGGPLDLDEIDRLVNPAAATNGSAHPPAPPHHEPVAPAPQPEPLSLGGSVVVRPLPAEPKASPRHTAPPRETPLLQNDVDDLLGLNKGPKFELDDEHAPKHKPVSGQDAMSLGDEPRGFHLSPQKATLLAVAVLVLLGIAFAAGFLTASHL